MLVIRELNRYGLTFCNNRDTVWRHDARALGEFTLPHAPAIHEANTRTDRLIGWMCQPIEDPDEHELPISLLANIITE